MSNSVSMVVVQLACPDKRAIAGLNGVSTCVQCLSRVIGPWLVSSVSGYITKRLQDDRVLISTTFRIIRYSPYRSIRKCWEEISGGSSWPSSRSYLPLSRSCSKTRVGRLPPLRWGLLENRQM